MNEKTSKLINRYSLAKGTDARSLKREWLSLSGKERFLKRQSMLKDLMGKKK